jgi:glycosyltransferase family protein
MKKKLSEKLWPIYKNYKYEIGWGENYPKVVSDLETLDVILRDHASIARLADGEFNLVFGYPCLFQEYDKNLSNWLARILLSKNEKVLIGIPDVFRNLFNYKRPSRKYWRKYLALNRDNIIKVLDLNKTYYNARITRPYNASAEAYKKISVVFEKWSAIWKGRDVIIIEGEKNLFGEGNDLLSTANVLKRIKAPSRDAFRVYSAILNAARKESKNELILISLGPTATVLTYELALLGYQTIDIGNLDMEYRNYVDKLKYEYK